MSSRALTWRGTPFSERTAELNFGALWMLWDRMMVVDLYTDAASELHAIRTSVAMGDMSPLTKHRISGVDAETLVDVLVTRNVTRLEPGHVYYTPWCDERGKLVGDGLVFRLDEMTFEISGDPAFGWFRYHADGYDVRVEDDTDEFGILTLQGPSSRAVLERATDESWDAFPFSRVRQSQIGGASVMVARQGFTGELGYELWVKADDGPRVWTAVETAGRDVGITAAGALALDLARVEAGLLIVGYDYTAAGSDRHGAAVAVSGDHEASPYELAMERFVDLEKERFIGKDALAREHAGHPRRRLVGLELDWRELVEAGERMGAAHTGLGRVRWYPLQLFHDGRCVGRATSVAWSPTLGRLIGFGHVEPALEQEGTRLTVAWEDTAKAITVGAEVVRLPFLELRRRGLEQEAERIA